jgi:hypothetical protein
MFRDVVIMHWVETVCVCRPQRDAAILGRDTREREMLCEVELHSLSSSPSITVAIKKRSTIGMEGAK